MKANIFCLAFALNIVFTQANAKMRRYDIHRVLQRVKSIEQFKRLVEFPKDVQIIEVPLPESEKRGLLPDGFTPNTTQLYNVTVSVPPCMARPVVVDMVIPNQTGAEFLVPYQVILYRCSGSVSADYRQYQCAPKSQTQFDVDVHELDLKTFNDTKIYRVQVVNHTECDKACIVGSDQCIPGLQKYVHSKCYCECLVDELKKTCNLTIHSVDHLYCKCACKTQNHTCEKDWVWSEKTCQCECNTEKVKKRCARNNKNFNDKECKCDKKD